MDRLDAMRVLLTVVDEGSLSAGSRKLNVPLKSVSRRVAELERHLGTGLLIRTSRNIELTDAGREYCEAARRIVADMDEAEMRASGEYEVPRGELKVSTTFEFGRQVALPLVCDFLREHPEIDLDVLTTNRFVDLTEERVDVAIRITQLADTSLFAVKVGEMRVITCASPTYLERKGIPRTPLDLAGHDTVWFVNVAASLAWDERTGDWMRVFPGENIARDPPMMIRIQADDAAVARKAAVQGLGITRLPNYLISDELKSGDLVEILVDYASDPHPVHIIYVKQGLLPLKVRAFLDWTTPRLRERLKKIEEDCSGLRARNQSSG